ncbi:MAG: short-chain dehydrogenase [Balneola sp.]|jgi:short-subunit dehydrogenase|nr:short-chain dehydrogenase [Balneola sp.]MBE80827.1 short-chain dehydrogenase [Balneola sp.]|tara:strand:- start:7310 stop:8089 length:780 start_codon:yes stop_codon:yes gene_type:complete
MQKAALITGASSGIGRDLATIHAEKGSDLIIVARRDHELKELKTELEAKYSVKVKVIAKDLIAENACEEIHEEIKREGINVEYLINNAGFGGHGYFHEQDDEYQQRMIDLNIKALTKLTRLFLPWMVERNSGRILNVASTAGLLPGPLQAVYYATKAYVVSLSQGIAGELMDTDVTCTALCPGPVETEFAEEADLEGTDLFKNAATSRSVAEVGYEAMMKGKLIAINDLSLKIQLEYLIPLAPRKMVLSTVKKMQEKRG